jgi:hypothetical protein
MKKFMILSLMAAIAAVTVIGEAGAANSPVFEMALRIFPGLAS